MKDTLTSGFNNLLDKAGKTITVKYFTQSIGSVYDDEVTLTEVTGSQLATSGIVLPISSKFGSEDLNLLEQGKLRTQDQKLYVNGSLDFNTGSLVSKIIIGTDAFTLVPLGGIPYEVEGVQIYKKTYIRSLPTGSLMGE